MSEYFDALETRDSDVRERALMAQLPSLIARAQTASGWAALLDGVCAADIDSRAALAQLRVTRKSDLQALQQRELPFGGLTSTPVAQLRRLFVSPGPIFDPQGQATDWWRAVRPMVALGVRRGEVLQNCFSYHFTPAAFMIEGAAALLGCPVIPAGVGQTDLQVQAMAALKPAAYLGTPSFLKLIIENAQASGTDIGSVQKALVSAEALPPSLRAWLQQNGVARVLQFYGTADIGVIAYETHCDGVLNPGMVLDEDVILEIVRPGTAEVLPIGEVGEMVITSLNPDYPLIRFGTGDMSAIMPGTAECGRTNTRIRGWLGRADQTTKVRGMFVHPSQVAEIGKWHPAIGKMRLVVSGAMGQDGMTLRCELADAGAVGCSGSEVEASIRAVTQLRGEVEFVAPGALPADGVVIEDARKYE